MWDDITGFEILDERVSARLGGSPSLLGGKELAVLWEMRRWGKECPHIEEITIYGTVNVALADG